MADDLQLSYIPGHILDGTSVYDQTLNVSSVGNTLEKPLTQIEGSSLSEYKQTLKYLLTLPVTYLYAGHTLQLIKVDVQDTLAYIHALSDNEAM